MNRHFPTATELDWTGYFLPVGHFIAQSRGTKKLYSLEEKRQEAINAAARELHHLLANEHVITDKTETSFWRETMPEALFGILGSFETRSSILACVALLRRAGVIVHTDDFPNLISPDGKQPSKTALRAKRPDPDATNEERLHWALSAVQTFIDLTRTDPEDAICDLLCDLMHLCDDQEKRFGRFEDGLRRARGHFGAEIENDNVMLSECCHAPIGYDAWADSNDVVCGGPFDACQCMNCGMEKPNAWDGKTLPWPREKREGGVNLPEGVEEPTTETEG